MPLVILCGFPCSGKTTRTDQLSKHVEENHKRTVNIISDHTLRVDRNAVYADSKQEKEVRGSLKSAVIRLMSRENVVILDSLNYIKGFRYELYCAVKSSQTPHCVIHCATSADQATTWNSQREEADRYSQEILDGLVMRFEAPESRNRWDSPLFTILPDDELPCEAICDAIFHRKAPPPNLSTVSQPLSETNFLHELDKITQEAVSILVNAQKTCVPGDQITIPAATEKVHLTRLVNASELQRIRRQFISYTKLHPIDDIRRLPNMFVQFFNNTIK
ncbi:protein KTI12 homolog isoform X2 [Amphiura filiformis]